MLCSNRASTPNDALGLFATAMALHTLRTAPHAQAGAASSGASSG